MSRSDAPDGVGRHEDDDQAVSLPSEHTDPYGHTFQGPRHRADPQIARPYIPPAERVRPGPGGAPGGQGGLAGAWRGDVLSDTWEMHPDRVRTRSGSESADAARRDVERPAEAERPSAVGEQPFREGERESFGEEGHPLREEEHPYREEEQPVHEQAARRAGDAEWERSWSETAPVEVGGGIGGTASTERRGFLGSGWTEGADEDEPRRRRGPLALLSAMTLGLAGAAVWIMMASSGTPTDVSCPDGVQCASTGERQAPVIFPSTEPVEAAPEVTPDPADGASPSPAPSTVSPGSTGTPSARPTLRPTTTRSPERSARPTARSTEIADTLNPSGEQTMREQPSQPSPSPGPTETTETTAPPQPEPTESPRRGGLFDWIF
jgi:hypothetical protein